MIGGKRRELANMLSEWNNSTSTPKPRAEGSSPSAPAKENKHGNGRACFLYEKDYRTLGTRSVSWGALASAAKSGKSEAKAGAAVEIRRAKERVSEFRAPQTGESFCPCQRKQARQSVLSLTEFTQTE